MSFEPGPIDPMIDPMHANRRQLRRTTGAANTQRAPRVADEVHTPIGDKFTYVMARTHYGRWSRSHPALNWIGLKLRGPNFRVKMIAKFRKRLES